MFFISFLRIAALRYAMLLLCVLGSLSVGKAQVANEPLQDIRNQVAHVIQPLNKAQIPTGYLYEYGHILYDPENYQGTLTDSNYVQPAQWQAIYGAVYASHLYGTQALPTNRTNPAGKLRRGA